MGRALDPRFTCRKAVSGRVTWNEHAPRFRPSHVHVLSLLGLLSFVCLLFATGDSDRVLATPKIVAKLFETSPHNLLYFLPFTFPSGSRPLSTAEDRPKPVALATGPNAGAVRQPVLPAVQEVEGREKEDSAKKAVQEAKRRVIEKTRTTQVSRTFEHEGWRQNLTQAAGTKNLAPKKKLAEVPVASLFCFCLILPWSDEPELISEQIELKAGVAACDKFSIYSNQVMEVGPARTLTKVLPNIDLHAERGGIYWTVMNTRIFKPLWRKVLDDKEWMHYDWTIKLDPDTVFFPAKFKLLVAHRQALQPDAESGHGRFIVNCRFGLHGPVEALSRQAMWVYHDEWAFCPTYPPQEDVYLQHCLEGLGVHPVQDYSVLAEKACHTPDYRNCTGNFVAFHPFKSKAEWARCLRLAAWTPFYPEGHS